MAIIKRREQDITEVEGTEIKDASLDILHMYPREMNIYGDYGNVLCLQKRITWRGMFQHTYNLNLNGVITDENGEVTDKKIIDFDIYFMGGGQDLDQADVYQDLLKYKSEMKQLVEDGKVFLLICGGYQLFGRSFLTVGGKTLEGLGILDIDTIGGETRAIGNIVVDSNIPELKNVKLVGFENHSGRTKILNSSVKTFGKVLAGVGNSENGGEEGGYYKNVYGCYLHGSFLPKNPEFADLLIKTAFDNKYGIGKIHLVDLDDYIERIAREKVINRIIK